METKSTLITWEESLNNGNSSKYLRQQTWTVDDWGISLHYDTAGHM